MTIIVRPAVSMMMGLALTLYGVVHAVARYPGSTAFSELMLGLPVLGHVALFMLGIVAAFAGVVLLVRNVRRLRYAWRHLQRVTGGRPAYDDPEQPAWSGGYR